MNKTPLLAYIPAFIALPIIYCIGVPLFYLLNLWSEKVNGVEPKSGMQRYTHKTVDGVQYFRRNGLRHRSTEWKPVPPTPPGYVNMDICSLYPAAISIERQSR